MRLPLLLSSALIGFFMNGPAFAQDSVYSEVWILDNISLINGHKATTTGSPKVIDTELGPAIYFNGVKDKLLVNSNPIGDARGFTVEMVFKPDAAFSSNNEPRFVHIQDPNDPLQKRVMMELRINSSNLCYLDGYMKTDIANLTLIDAKLTHPTNVWHHAAITYANDTLTTWFNGKKELQGFVPFGISLINKSGQTSLGARMNDRNYYKGAIRALRISHAALRPDAFSLLGLVNPTGPTALPQPNMANVSVSMGTEHILLSLKDQEGKKWTASLFNITGQRLYHSVQEGSTVDWAIPLPANRSGKEVLLLKVSTRDMVFSQKIVR
jgi:hypothetical protein